MKILFIALFCIISVTAYSSDQLIIKGVNVNSDTPVRNGLFNVQWSITSSTELGEIEFVAERVCESGQQASSFKLDLSHAKVSQGNHLVALCDGNFVNNKINVVAKTNEGNVIRSNSLKVYSDTIAPTFPVFTVIGQAISSEFLLFSGSVKDEKSGTVEIFYVNENRDKIVVGGAAILADSSFNAIVSLKSLPSSEVNLIAVAYDQIKNESFKEFVTKMDKTKIKKTTIFQQLHK